MFAALTFCATFFIKIPMIVVGYINLGDCLVLASGWLLGPVWGCAAAAIGSSLADLVGGYAIYALPTFAIKGLMAIVAYLIYVLFSQKFRLFGRILAATAAECIMIGGYFLFEGIVYDFTTAMASISFNVIQGVCGLVIAVLLTEVLLRLPHTAKRFDSKNINKFGE